MSDAISVVRGEPRPEPAAAGPDKLPEATGAAVYPQLRGIPLR